MEKLFKIIIIIALVIILITVLFFGVMAIYHHIMLSNKKNLIKTAGKLVKVDGFNMNVYVEGVEQKKKILPLFCYQVQA